MIQYLFEENMIDYSLGDLTMPLQCCKEKFSQIPDDEPVFILRGQDLLALETVRHWMILARRAGVNAEKMRAVELHHDAILNFRIGNPNRVKVPD